MIRAAISGRMESEVVFRHCVVLASRASLSCISMSVASQG